MLKAKPTICEAAIAAGSYRVFLGADLSRSKDDRGREFVRTHRVISVSRLEKRVDSVVGSSQLCEHVRDAVSVREVMACTERFGLAVGGGDGLPVFWIDGERGRMGK